MSKKVARLHNAVTTVTGLHGPPPFGARGELGAGGRTEGPRGAAEALTRGTRQLQRPCRRPLSLVPAAGYRVSPRLHTPVMPGRDVTRSASRENPALRLFLTAQCLRPSSTNRMDSHWSLQPALPAFREEGVPRTRGHSRLLLKTKQRSWPRAGEVPRGPHSAPQERGPGALHIGTCS